MHAYSPCLSRWLAVGLFFACPCLASAQYAKLSGRLTSGKSSKEIVIPEGKVAVVLNFVLSLPDRPDLRNLLVAYLSVDGVKVLQGRLIGSGRVEDDRPAVVPGPAKIIVEVPRGADVNFYLSYKLIDNTEERSALTDGKAPALLSTNTVVIPEDQDGLVRILLESSTDLINWNEALPGQYGSSTKQRFFRIRAVRTKDP